MQPGLSRCSSALKSFSQNRSFLTAGMILLNITFFLETIFALQKYYPLFLEYYELMYLMHFLSVWHREVRPNLHRNLLNRQDHDYLKKFNLSLAQNTNTRDLKPPARIVVLTNESHQVIWGPCVEIRNSSIKSKGTNHMKQQWKLFHVRLCRLAFTTQCEHAGESTMRSLTTNDNSLSFCHALEAKLWEMPAFPLSFV